ncbi:hypothetical protein J4401_04605 [Candidatus Woesearchaeota archaeon]|nr:hypothetical protein [Candidatus Woesearchaeota archaeon]
MRGQALLSELFDRKVIKVLMFLVANMNKDLYLNEISHGSNVPLATSFRILGKMARLGIVQEVKVRKLKLYRCVSNDSIDFLEGLLKGGSVADSFAKAVASYGNIEEILLHGKEEADKANILIIGTGINHNEVKMLCADYKEKFKFNINYLTLEKEQYEQMSRMGLYSGKKSVLFRK